MSSSGDLRDMVERELAGLELELAGKMPGKSFAKSV
jgi:hypothetical protein